MVSQVVINSVLRVIIAYFLLLFLARFMGRKLISHMTFFDFVVGIIVGSVVATMSVDQNNPLVSGISILIVLALLTVGIDLLDIKSFVSRKLFDSEPVLIIENGKLNAANMSRTRLPMDQLMMLLREKNVFNIADVEFAVFETDGKLSVLLKSQKQPVRPSDLGISTTYYGLTKELIIDGNVLNENLESAHLDRQWLTDSLKNYGIRDIKDVFFAGLDTQGNLYVSKKNIDREKHGEYGLE